MTPPPSPRAPATNPPPKPRSETVFKVLPLNTRSLAIKFGLTYLYFKVYSAATLPTANLNDQYIKPKKSVIVVQSSQEHLSNAIFLSIFIHIFANSPTALIPYFFQIKCPVSYNVKSLNFTISK